MSFEDKNNIQLENLRDSPDKSMREVDIDKW